MGINWDTIGDIGKGPGKKKGGVQPGGGGTSGGGPGGADQGPQFEEPGTFFGTPFPGARTRFPRTGGFTGLPPIVTPFPIAFFNPWAAVIYATIAELTNVFLPDVGAWVNEKAAQSARERVIFPAPGLGFTPKREFIPGIETSPIPVPQFDSGLGLQAFLDKSPRIAVGELAFDTLKKNAVQLSAKEFIMDVKPIEWQMIEALYDIKIYDAREWEYKTNQNYPGWRARVYNGLYDPQTQELNARWTYRRTRRVG